MLCAQSPSWHLFLQFSMIIDSDTSHLFSTQLSPTETYGPSLTAGQILQFFPIMTEPVMNESCDMNVPSCHNVILYLLVPVHEELVFSAYGIKDLARLSAYLLSVFKTKQVQSRSMIRIDEPIRHYIDGSFFLQIIS